MSKVLSVRLDDKLYTKCKHSDLGNRDLVVKALSLYFRSKEPNGNLNSVMYTGVYNKEYVDLLHQQISDLHRDKEFLQGQVSALMVQRLPLLQRVIQRLKSA